MPGSPSRSAVNVLSIWILPGAARDRAQRFPHRATHDVRCGARVAAARGCCVFLLAAAFDQGSHALYYTSGRRTGSRSAHPGGCRRPLAARHLIESTIVRVFAAGVQPDRIDAPSDLGAADASALDDHGVRSAAQRRDRRAIAARRNLALAPGRDVFIQKAVPPRLAATAQSLYAMMSNGIVMGRRRSRPARALCAFAGRAYPLMSAMGGFVLLGFLLQDCTADG